MPATRPQDWGSQWMLLLRHRVADATVLMAQVAEKGDAY